MMKIALLALVLTNIILVGMGARAELELSREQRRHLIVSHQYLCELGAYIKALELGNALIKNQILFEDFRQAWIDGNAEALKTCGQKDA